MLDIKYRIVNFTVNTYVIANDPNRLIDGDVLVGLNEYNDCKYFTSLDKAIKSENLDDKYESYLKDKFDNSEVEHPVAIFITLECGDTSVETIRIDDNEHMIVNVRYEGFVVQDISKAKNVPMLESIIPNIEEYVKKKIEDPSFVNLIDSMREDDDYVKPFTIAHRYTKEENKNENDK